jgi:Xaa-Pro aminopeptidase
MSGCPERRRRLAAVLTERDLAAAVVTAPANVRYLTGYVGSNGIAVVTRDGCRLLTDSRYALSARHQADDGVDVRIGTRDLLEDVAAAVAELAPGGRVGVEADHLTMARGERLRALVADADAAAEIVPGTGAVEGLRLVKDPEEVARIRRAAAIVDEALARVLAAGLAGRTERQVAWSLAEAFEDLGAEGPSFETIVAAGPNGARPHAVPGAEVIPEGTLVVIDLGAIADGYCSDMTRTVATGPVPPELGRAYEVVLRAQAAAVDACRPGVGCAELDAVARGVIEDAGFGEAFGHGLGHGVGLEIHEGPRLSREGRGELRPGMVVTVEPGIYLEGLGGVRIEDLVLVTDDGREVLSRAPKDPVPPTTG